ncbi:MAG: class I SAM-dependent methyltransferase [Patescibacteria group bacterium]
MSKDHITQTIDVYNAIAADYADTIENYAPQKELDQFLRLVKKGGEILDVGCAAGRDSFYFAEHELKVTGIDLSEQLLKIARKKGPHLNFKKQDMRQLKFSPASFDGIWAHASLLHLSRNEVPSVLRQFFKILKSTGILYISVKVGDGEADVIDDFSSEYPRHFTFFRKVELNKMIGNSGFKVLNIYKFTSRTRTSASGGPLNWIASFSRKP